MPNADIKLKSSIYLALDEQRKLVDLLFDCPTMSRKETRDVVVQELPSVVRGSMERIHQIDKFDIRQIVVACKTYSGGLEALIDIVEYYEGDSIPFQALDSFVKELFDRDANYKKEEQLEQLKSIILEIDLTDTDLKQLYLASAPNDPLYNANWQYPKNLEQDKVLSWIFTQLVNVNPPENVIHPILKFVERLAIHTSVNDSHRSELRKWVDDVALTWGANVLAIDEMRKNLTSELEKAIVPTAKESEPPSLLIMLELNDKSNLNKFRVKVWLLYNQEDVVPLHLSSEPYTSDTIVNLIDELLEKVVRNSSTEEEALAQLRVEFFLPRELFCLRVENWLVNKGILPLGVRNQVVVRSSERIHDVRNRPYWVTRWKKARDPSYQILLITQSKVDESGLPQAKGIKLIYRIYDSKSFDGRHAYSLLAENVNVVCLCLMHVPPVVTDLSSKEELFSMMFMAGAPIVLWPAYLPDDQQKIQEIQQTLSSLLSSHKLSEFPDLIWKQRLDAWKSREVYHLGNYLTLLWDDPNRLPPDM